MDVPKLPVHWHWVEQVLVPYLRYAFSRDLQFGDDIAPIVRNAVKFCETKPDYPTDGDDLLFERVFQAIEFPWLNLEPDLQLLTKNMEPLARFLIRRAQLKGPYELLGRSNIASHAWREFQEYQVEGFRRAAEEEKRSFLDALQSPTPPPRTAITEDQIDPRLVGALPGQYLLQHVSESLTVDEDRSFRVWNRHHKEGSTTGYWGSSWLQQVQHAALPDRTRQFSHPGSGSGPMYEQHRTYTSTFPQPMAPSYMQNLRSQQLVYPSQAATMHGNNDVTAVVGHPVAPHTFHQPFNAATGMWSSSASMYQSVQTYQQHPQAVQGTTHPNQYHIRSTNTAPAGGPTYTSSLANANLSKSPIIPTEDIDHLRGKEWIEAVEKRARDFQLLLPKDPKNMLAPRSIQQNADSSLQRSLLMRDEASTLSTAPMAPAIDHAAASNDVPLQPHEKAEENGAQMGNGTGTPHFVTHPEFSNITSSFPEYPY